MFLGRNFKGENLDRWRILLGGKIMTQILHGSRQQKTQGQLKSRLNAPEMGVLLGCPSCTLVP